jgi:hypothetical protein
VTPVEEARRIVDQYAPEIGRREELMEAIRWAIVQGQIAAKQPPELPASMAGTIVYQVLFFVDEVLDRLRGSDVVEQANELRLVRARVVRMFGITPLNNADVHKKPVVTQGSQKRKVARA